MQRRYFQSIQTARSFLRKKRQSQADSFLKSDVYVMSYPGSRIVEFKSSETGNMITTSMITKISDHLSFFKKNHTVAAVFFASDDPDVFSNGLSIPYDHISIKQLQELSLQIQSCGEHPITLAANSGQLGSSPFALFATSKYRLANMGTVLSVSELHDKNQYPVGGVAYHLTKSCSEGLAAARYLGITGKPLGVDGLYSMGLITHIVEEGPQISICDGLAKTISPTYESKKWQGEVVSREAINSILETMDANSDIDLSDEKLDEKMYLIPPQELYRLETDDSMSDNDLFDHSSSMEYCLSEDSLLECNTRLKKFYPKEPDTRNWAMDMSEAIESLDIERVKSWFRLTRSAKNATDLQTYFESEWKEVEEIMK